MNHPQTILRTLDSHMVRPTRLILYGRSALALGFSGPPADFLATLDVDAILPRVFLATIEQDDAFWDALEQTNADLEPSGLYITHLFVDDQLILTPDWLDRIQPILLEGTRHLQLFRPDPSNLVLTKMMRVDPQDRADIHFLLKHVDEAQLKADLDQASLPELDEIREAFAQNREWLLEQIE